jgi:NADH-quinone oxidoreductase subunit K
MHPVLPYALAAALFAVGLYGVLVRRNAVLLLMAVELLLNAVNLVFVTADVSVVGVPRSGQVFALFVIVLAAAEIGVGLAIVLQLYRVRRTIAVDQVDRAGEPSDSGERSGEPPPADPAGRVPPADAGEPSGAVREGAR